MESNKLIDKNYNPSETEKYIQESWAEDKIHDFNTQSSKPLFSIDTPPPTVSGSLHIGHIFSYTHTDIIARYKRLSGFEIFYPMGFDDNGLPTEKFVEKKHNIIAQNLSRSDFIDLCLKETHEVEKQFESLWRRMGLSVDWSLLYSTISPETRKISQLSFIELYKKGYIYRKSEPALYCTTCRTTIAQAELEDIEKHTLFVDIAFKGPEGDLVISTTRPELLPSCVALLYNPKDSRYQYLENRSATVPIFGHKVIILADESVDIEKGTGLVMCCTFGDKTDILWYKKYNLPYRPSIGLDGKWLPETDALSGLRVVNAREKILELLKDQGFLKAQKEISHSVNVHERCKKEIEYLVLPQWFLNILPYKQKFIEIGDQINWYPEFMKFRYKNWVENLNWDWCLSRQRFFGIPFPVWHCNSCNEILIADEKQLPIDPQETRYESCCHKCGEQNITPDMDMMDTWNTSSLTPYICLDLYNKAKGDNSFDFDSVGDFIPMSMRPQAHDIIRTWAFYTIVKSWMHNNTKPWDSIVISGHVLSNKKEKISKSKGNSTLTPENLLESYSADAIRFWTASARLGYDTAFSENQLQIGQKLTTKLWNAFRFAQTYIENFKPDNMPEELDITNRWILNEISNTYKNYCNYLNNNEFSLALDTTDKFFWSNYCDNYLELIKGQLSNPEKHTNNQIYSTKWTLYHVGIRILQLYAPYMPHITDYLYSLIYKDVEKTKSLHITDFSKYQTQYNYDPAASQMKLLLEVISKVRKLKSENKLSLKTDLEKIVFVTQNLTLTNLIKENEELIKEISKAKLINYEYSSEEIYHLDQLNDQYNAKISV